MDKPLTQTLTVRIDFVIVVAGKKRFSQENINWFGNKRECTLSPNSGMQRRRNVMLLDIGGRRKSLGQSKDQSMTQVSSIYEE